MCVTCICMLGVHMGGCVCVWFRGIHCLTSLAVVSMYVLEGRRTTQRGKYKDEPGNQILFS